MALDFISIIFICSLSLADSSVVTSGPNENITQVTRGQNAGNVIRDQVTVEVVTLNPSEVVGQTVTPAVTVDAYHTETKEARSPTSRPTTQTMPSKTFSTDGPTTATVVVSSQTSNPTATASIPPMLSTSTQSQDTGQTFLFTSDRMHRLSTHLTQTTTPISTTITSAKPVDKTSTSPGKFTDDATHSTGLYRTVRSTTKITTKAKTNQDLAPKQSSNASNHSKIVAGLIGGALGFMMLGFLLIYMKKRKFKRQLITTSDWAGRSPFLQGGPDDVEVKMRSSNQISLSSFLPQRLSKRFSQPPETTELGDITLGSTFVGKRQGSTSEQELAVNDEQKTNGTAAVGPGMEEAPKTVENSVTVAAVQTNEPPSTTGSDEVPPVGVSPGTTVN